MKNTIFLVCLMLAQNFMFEAKSSRSLKAQCDTCISIVKEFKEGLKKTEKSNFEGGNTHWEESRLGKYSTSETRLVEIIDEHVCKAESKECTHMLEESEEIIENYWFKVFAVGKKISLKRYLCIARLRVCCPDNTFGEKCEACAGGKENPCSGHGTCNGEGTREGTGKCSCHSGYTGDRCDSCADRFYEANKSEQAIDCKACDQSCKSTCWEAGPKGCDDCKNGYEQTEQDGCKDIDECTSSPCEDGKYCTNTAGSFSCNACHKACSICSGWGRQKCSSCTEGYRLAGEQCDDIDECTDDSSLCSGPNEHCVNLDGSHKCECDDQHELSAPRDEGGQCLPKTEEPPSGDAEAEKVEEPISAKDDTSKAKQKKSKVKKRKKRKTLLGSDLQDLGAYFSCLLLFCLGGNLLRGDVMLTLLLCVLLVRVLWLFG